MTARAAVTADGLAVRRANPPHTADTADTAALADAPADVDAAARRAREQARTAAVRGEPGRGGAGPVVGVVAVGLCYYRAPDRVVVALAGPGDRCGRGPSRALAAGLARLPVVELRLDCAVLEGCSAALARALARLRIQKLITGVRVHISHPPPALVSELGARPATAFTLRTDPAALITAGVTFRACGSGPGPAFTS